MGAVPEGTTGVRTLTTDTISQIINWTVPADEDTNLAWWNCTVYNSSGDPMGWSNQTNVTGLNYNNYTLTNVIDISAYPDGNYKMNCTVTDRVFYG